MWAPLIIFILLERELRGPEDTPLRASRHGGGYQGDENEEGAREEAASAREARERTSWKRTTTQTLLGSEHNGGRNERRG